VFQRPAPVHLPRHLLFAITAYRIQADRLGDLDHETTQVLDRTDSKETGAAMSARLVSFDQKRTELTPGTVLVREWDRHSQRVMVMADGFTWNGRTYDSLSKVAFAITGTKWDGALKWMLATASVTPEPVLYDGSVLQTFPSSTGMQHDERLAGLGILTRVFRITYAKRSRILPVPKGKRCVRLLAGRAQRHQVS
jgi:Protein of unknown function (DUF2924)